MTSRSKAIKDLTEVSLLLMSRDQLERLCQDAGLEVDGTAVVLRKRMRDFIRTASGEDFDDGTSHALKVELVSLLNEGMTRIKIWKPMNTLSEPDRIKILDLCEAKQKFVCPLTKELMYDPVLAEDGCLYERYAIARHFFPDGDHPGDNGEFNERWAAKSPVTGEVMGMRLVLAPDVKSRIESLLENGFFSQNLVEGYKKMEAKQQSVEEMMDKADAGDIDLMIRVGWKFASNRADEICPFNMRRALSYFKKAHVAGSKAGTLYVAFAYRKLHQPRDAFAYTLFGAGRGQPDCLHALGAWIFNGDHDLEQDRAEGLRLMQAAIDDYETNGGVAKGWLESKKNTLEACKRHAANPTLDPTWKASDGLTCW